MVRVPKQKVFFSTTTANLAKFRAAYPGKRHLIIEVSTACMIEAHRNEIKLCRFNAGACRMPTNYKNFNIFKSIAEFPYSAKCKPKEFTVAYKVKGIAALATKVYEVGGGQEYAISDSI